MPSAASIHDRLLRLLENTARYTGAEFFAAPWDLTGANANPDKRPNAVNNSWGDCSRSYDPWYQDVVDAWHAAGIYPVFSNGNASNCGYPAPPGLNTVGNPARYGNVTGVGSSGRDNGQYAIRGHVQFHQRSMISGILAT